MYRETLSHFNAEILESSGIIFKCVISNIYLMPVLLFNNLLISQPDVFSDNKPITFFVASHSSGHSHSILTILPWGSEKVLK